MSGGGQTRAALELAAVGHRITHKRRLADPKQLTLVAVGLARTELSRSEGRGAVTGSRVGTAVSKATSYSLQDDGTKSEECPSPTGTIKEGSVNTFLGKESMPVALVDQGDVPCDKHNDKPIRKGAEDVWVNNLPVARRTDETCCGAHVGEGDPTVWVGAQTQTRKPLDMNAAQATVHELLDSLFGPEGATTTSSRVGMAVAGGSSDEGLLPESVTNVIDSALSSEIGKSLLEGDYPGAVSALREKLGF